MMDQTLPPAEAQPPRRWFPVASAVILGINVVIFLAWAVSDQSEALANLLNLHFVISPGRLSQGWIWTLLTSEFSQINFTHFLFNMIVLWSFGGALERVLGRRRYVAFYLVAAVVASASHCFVTAFLMDRGDVAAVGASGALSGVVMVFALLFPRNRILLFMVIPIPALVGALGFVALDIWGLVAQGLGGGLPIGHGAHLGGSLTGLLMYFVVLRPRLQLQERAEVRGTAPQAVPLSEDEAREFERLRLKITHEGYDRLTPKEQDFLTRLRDRVVGN